MSDGGKGAEKNIVLWHPGFGLAAAVVLLGLTAGAAWVVVSGIAPFQSELDDRFRLAATIAVVLLLIGVAVIGSGIWMLTVEFRGRMRTREDGPKVAELVAQRGGAASGAVSALPETLEAFSKLSGPSAVVVAGLVPLVAAAWIAVAAVEPAAEAPSEGPSPSVESPSPAVEETPSGG